MNKIANLLTSDHRSCDQFLATCESAVSRKEWALARSAFADFQAAMLTHFDSEESILFPQFEQRTGISRGPTHVMRSEHLQMRQLLLLAAVALDANDVDDYCGHTETLLIMMQQHNVKEENVLYPMCDQQLADSADRLITELAAQLGRTAKVSP
ncbi:MAG TPA: hemerythrin domain-containing protein [Accumulibacter sp.]|nr:hemerythrin domain-containing protein [Accumulibacter sp.]HPP48100.1 hemerythrin domain-containing protein [Accumulibacter sp.]